MEIFRIDTGEDGLIVRRLEPHEVEGDKKFYIEMFGEPALSADQIARLNQAVQASD